MPRPSEKRSLRAIAAELERLGHVYGKGRRFDAAQVARMIVS
jgi:hypothetical protein